MKPVLDAAVQARLLGLAMDVWAWWWTEVGLPAVDEVPQVALLRWTWPEN